jgi:hypothetical protein
MSFTKRLLAGVLTALAAFVSTAAPADALEVAIQDDAVLVEGAYYDRARALSQIRDLGATRVRINLSWREVLGSQARRRKQPRTIKYNWRKYDEAVNAARFYGLKVHLTVTGPAPRWATRNKRIGVYRPDSGKYGAFARSTASHFAGRVDRYSIWNEPNYKGWIQPLKDAPRIYRGLYRSGWRGIKSVQPGAPVFIGETSPYAIKGRSMAPLSFMRRMLCVNSNYTRRRCTGLFTDGYAHHPYDYRHAPEYKYPGKDNVTIGTLGRLNTALGKFAAKKALRTRWGGAPRIFLTEFGYMHSGKYRIPAGRRAAYLRRSFSIARRTPRVESMLNYLLVSPPKQWSFFDTSLVTRGGTPTAAYHALRNFTRP